MASQERRLYILPADQQTELFSVFHGNSVLFTGLWETCEDFIVRLKRLRRA